VFLYDPSLAESVPAYLSDPSSVELGHVINPALFVTILFASFVFGPSLKRMLNIVGYGEEQSRHLLGYLKSRGLRDLLMVSFMVLYAVCYVISGWSVREQADISLGYFSAAIIYVLMLIIYGLFYPWYIPERYTSDSRVIFEGLLLLVLVASPVNVLGGFALTTILLAILFMKTQQHEEVKIESVLEQEKKELVESLLYKVSSLFIEHHKRFSVVYFGVLLVVTMATALPAYLDTVSPWLPIIIVFGGWFLFFAIAVEWAVRLARQES
jgi:hypothetical protein